MTGSEALNHFYQVVGELKLTRGEHDSLRLLHSQLAAELAAGEQKKDGETEA